MNRLVGVVRVGCHKRATCHVKQSNIRTLYLTPKVYKDDDSKVPENDNKKQKAKTKLNSILQDLQVSGALDLESEVDSKLARPKFSRPIRRDKEGKFKSNMPSTKDIDSDMVAATKDVAQHFDKPVKAESELLKRLKQVAKETDQAKKENEVSGEDLGSLFGDMRIDRPLAKVHKKSAETLKNASDRQQLSMEQMAFLQKRAKLRRADQASKQVETSVDLESGVRLGIFTGPVAESSDAELLGMWRHCQERELGILSTPPPRNALEEMILQTKQGKLWHFPVNNEQGLDYSDDPFYNHVFLEHHLEPWCPRSGPIRQFMETVCLGLSQNPYMASQKKIDTIMWFKDYFEKPDHKEILVHSGCWEDSDDVEVSN